MTNRLPEIKISNRLDLFSVRRAEALFRTPISDLQTMSAMAGSQYLPFDASPKPRWFQKIAKPKKTRRIDNPREQLKKIQRRILIVLKTVPLPAYVKGGVSGQTLLDNIKIHANSEVLVTVDVKNFFRSINSKRVYKIWRYQLNCSRKLASILTKLTTFEGHLPQGASTSTYLANLLIVSLEPDILSACESLGIKFSTWVDDLAFSGPNAPQVIDTIVQVLRSVGLSVSHKKLRVMRPGSRKSLNGIVIGMDLNLSSEYRRAIRSGIHKLRSGAVREGLLVKYVRSLKGRIEYLASVNGAASDQFQSELIEALAELGLNKDCREI
jgi:hypothetical protein